MGDLKQNAASLIKLSHFKLETVLNGLIHLYTTLQKQYLHSLQQYSSTTKSDVPITPRDSNSASSANLNNAQAIASSVIVDEDHHDRFVRSKIIIFQLIFKTLSAAIGYDKLDLRFEDDFLSDLGDLSTKDESAEESTEVTGTPSETAPTTTTPTEEEELFSSTFDQEKLPKLDDRLAQTLLNYIMDQLFPGFGDQKLNDKERLLNAQKVPTLLKHLAARVLFKLSVLSFDAVFFKVENFFKTMKADDVDLSVCHMIEYLCFDEAKLSRLINILMDANAKLKKNALVAIAQPLRQAIWNWITNYPHQFMELSKNKPHLNENVVKFFDLIYDRKLKKYNAQLWPLQCMLLLLAPKLFYQVIMFIKEGKDSKIPEPPKKQRKFLESILKALKAGKESVAIVCFVDLNKATTYLAKSQDTQAMKMGVALRLLMSLAQTTMQDRLIMNQDAPLTLNADGKIDVNLMVDFLVSAYRINQRNVTSYIFPICFRGSGIFKLVMTKALLKLAQKDGALPWHPTLAGSYSYIAKPVRLLFQDLLKEERTLAQQMKQQQSQQQGVIPMNNNPIGNNRSQAKDAAHTTETLLNLLAVFYAEPMLVLENTSGTLMSHINDVLYLFMGLTNCLVDVSHQQIVNQAYRLLQKLFDSKYVLQWCREDIATAFIECSSSVIIQLGMNLQQDKEIQSNSVKLILDLVKEITSSSNRFLLQHGDKITAEHLKSRKRIQLWESAESTLLVLLCSTESEVWATAASCFGDLCDQIDIIGSKESKSNGIVANYNLYRKLSNLDELGRGSRSQQHKGIRRLLRRVELQTKANLSAFIEVYSRWKTYTAQLLDGATKAKDAMDDTNSMHLTKHKNMWKNYTAFLCALGGVCLQSSETNVYQGRANKNTNVTDDLIKDLMRLVVSDHPMIRDTVTQTIGTDLSPAMYGILFQNLHATVGKFFSEEGSIKITATSTQFVDQSIHIVKSVIEQAEENVEDLSLANFESLILSFVQYCSQLPLSHDTVRVKCKLCILIETMMAKKQYINMGNEVFFRFNVLQKIAEWTSDFAQKSGSTDVHITAHDDDGRSTTRTQGSTGSDVTFRDLDVLCMRAIASVLKGLQLAKVKRQGDKGNAKDKNEANKREFLKYFKFLSQYLQKSKTDKESHPQLREYTILSLGNLLESNINYGLEQFMKMAYIEDQETRSAFLAVLTKVMKQGIKLEQDDSSRQQPVHKYDRLLEILTADHMSIVFVILSSIQVNDLDELCRSLVKLFAERNKAQELLFAAIDNEVEATNTPGTLFRANSYASKMLTAYCNLVAGDYLKKTLSGLVSDIINNPVSMEVDPSKLKGEDLEANTQNLVKVAQTILDQFTTSIDQMPEAIRNICHYLSKKVEEKFPAGQKNYDTVTSPSDDVPDTDEEGAGHAPRHVAIGGLLFLRFLNPVIVSPNNKANIVLVEEQPSTIAQRSLLLISKLLQNVANGVKFSRKGKQTVKEAFMQPLDFFVVNNLQKAREYFDNVSKNVTKDPGSFPIEEDVKDAALLTVHRFVYNNIDKVQQKSNLNAQLVEKLQSVLAELGRPPEKQKQLSGGSAASTGGDQFTMRTFQNFMNLYKTVDLKPIEEKRIFYLGQGMSVDQRPVLYFVPRHYISGDFPLEHLFYHCLKILQSVFTKPFEVVVDCTDFREDQTTLEHQHFITFHKLVPPGGRKNMARITIYNPNSQLRDTFSRKLTKMLSRKVSKKIRFATSKKELQQFIDENSIDLQDTSLNFDEDVQTTISPAWVVGEKGSQQEAILKLSSKKLAVILKKVNLFGVDTRLIDFIDISTIGQVKAENNPYNHLDQVVVPYDWPVKQIVLRTENNDQLMMSIKQTVARFLNNYQLAASIQVNDTQSSEKSGINQQDIPGMMLNLSFLNLESKFPKTRQEAYNLLAALAEQFDFPVTLLEAPDLCVPHNTADLVVALSEQVASAKPFLTPQFLRECLRGFNKVSLPYKFLCLKYMKPWIKNLSSVYAKAQEENEIERVEIIRDWFPSLVHATVEQPEIYPALLSEIWGEISRDESLVNISVDCILASAVQGGVQSAKLDILNDLVVTLASADCSKIVMDEILAQTMHVIESEIESDAQGPAWDKLIIYCRFLMMLSFQDRVIVKDNLPTLLFLITLVVGRGSLFFRATIHALTCNVIHSLATAIKFNNEQRKIMQEHLAQLSTQQYRVMFMGNDIASSDPFVKVTAKAKELDPVKMNDMEVLTLYFQEVMKTVFQVDPELQRRWHSELLDMVKDQVLRVHPVWLPRALTVYGVVVKPGQEATDTLPFILDCLMNSIRTYTPASKGQSLDLPVSALLCLGQYCLKMDPDDPVLRQIFLIPIMLSAGSDPVLFSAVVHLFDCVLSAIAPSKAFRECGGLEEYFNRYCRDSNTDPLVTKFEKMTGISFKTHFSFALSTLFMKGLTASETKERTAQICTTLINVVSKINNNVNEILGYITALIPYNYESLTQLLGENFTLFTEETFAHPNSALLFTRYLLTIVENVEFDQYREHIYGVLSEAFRKIPSVFEGIYPDVMAKVIEVYKTAASARIVEVSLSLINAMMMETDRSFHSEGFKEDRLKNIQFAGMVKAGSFKHVTEKSSQEVCSLSLEYIKNNISSHLDRTALNNMAKQQATRKKKPVRAQTLIKPVTPTLRKTGSTLLDEKSEKTDTDSVRDEDSTQD
jgi:neurofibromin 1